MRLLFLAPLLFLVSCGKSPTSSQAPASPILPGDALVWTPINPTHTVTPGEVGARFTFTVTNISSFEVVITNVKPSCGCTVADMPSHPWRIKAHESGKLDAVMDLRDKVAGVATPSVYYKDILVLGEGFTNDLTFTVAVPAMTNNLSAEEAMRLWGRQLSTVDHQAVFKNDCVKCHLVPAFGKSGEYLFHTICGICHEAASRASVVPDLSQLKTPIDPHYWSNWVTLGKTGTLMPGFASTEGGPLDDEQVRGLVDYLARAFPRPMINSATNTTK